MNAAYFGGEKETMLEVLRKNRCRHASEIAEEDKI